MELGKYYFSIDSYHNIFYIKVLDSFLDKSVLIDFISIRANVCIKNYRWYSSKITNVEITMENYMENLPDNEPEKIVYIRNKKIKNLLKCSY